MDAWLTEVSEADRRALTALRSLVAAEREAARTTMLADLDSQRYELFVGRFGRMLRSARGRRTGPPLPARAVAPDLIEERFNAFRKAAEKIGDASPAADYHRVRIRGKRFRYALEFLADLYPAGTRLLTRRMIELQDILGLHQDAEVAIDRLRGLALERGGELLSRNDFRDGRDSRALPAKCDQAEEPVSEGLRPRQQEGVERAFGVDRERAPCPFRPSNFHRSRCGVRSTHRRPCRRRRRLGRSRASGLRSVIMPGSGRELARQHELRLQRLAGRHVSPAIDLRFEFRERAGRDVPVRPLAQRTRCGKQQQEFHEARVVPHEHRLVDLVGKCSDAVEERVYRGRVQSDLERHGGLAEAGKHPLQRLLCTHGVRADDELRANAVLLCPTSDSLCRLATPWCERAVAVAERRIVPS